MMRVHRVLHTSEGWVLEVLEVPIWAAALSRGTEYLDAASGHWLCAEGLPDWTWSVPCGLPLQIEVDEDTGERWLANGLGAHLYGWFSRLLFVEDLQARVVARLPISEEFAQLLLPDYDWANEDEEAQ